MAEVLIKKLQIKDRKGPFLIANAPSEYIADLGNVLSSIDTEPNQGAPYPFVQVFATNLSELKAFSLSMVEKVNEKGLLWVCYPKKSSPNYPNAGCSRDLLWDLLGDQGFEVVRLIAIDEDWSAARFKRVEQIKKLTRKRRATQKA